MGIKGLWKLLEPAFGKRVTIDELATEFLLNNNRNLRLAIDAYMFVFRSSLGGRSLSIQGFMSKVLYLISLNITFVVVFDGKYKPTKLRNLEFAEEYESTPYVELFNDFKSTEDYSEMGGIQDYFASLKAELLKNQIDWLQSPGEGEAQCAQMQKLGIVDYVVSDDVDTLVFGCTKVLRNLRRSALDDDNNGAKYYYATPVEMVDIELKTGLTSDRLIFLAVLSGGDYSNGAIGIGIENATRIALCGTVFHQEMIEEKLKKRKKKTEVKVVDFAAKFSECIPSDLSRVLQESEVISDLLVRDLKFTSDLQFSPELHYSPDLLIISDFASDLKFTSDLRNLSNLLNYELSVHSREICGRLLNLSENIVLSDLFSVLYKWPIVHPSHYKFLPGRLSCGDLKVQDADLLLEAPKDGENVKNEFIRINQCKIVGKLLINQDGQVFIPVEDISTSVPSFTVDTNFSWNPNRVILKLLGSQVYKDHKNLFYISKSDTKENLECLMVKYDFEGLREIFPLWKRRAPFEPPSELPDVIPGGDERKAKAMPYVWLPRALINHVNQEIVLDFDFAQIQLQEERKSPRKKGSPKKQRYTPQKTNLFSFSSFKVAAGNAKEIATSFGVKSAPVLPFKIKYSPRKLPLLPRASLSITDMLTGRLNVKETSNDKQERGPEKETQERGHETETQQRGRARMEIIPDLSFSRETSLRDESPTPKRRKKDTSVIVIPDFDSTDGFGDEGDTTVLKAAAASLAHRKSEKQKLSAPNLLDEIGTQKPNTENLLDEIAGDGFLSDTTF